MNLDQLILFGIFPAALVVLAGMFVRWASGRRFLLFLLAMTVALLLAAFLAGWFGRPAFTVSWLVAPATLGVLALVVLHLKEFATLQRGEKILALALSLISAALLAGVGGQGVGLVFYILPGAAVLTVVWAVGRMFRSMAALFAAAALVLLGLCNALITGVLVWPAPSQPPSIPAWLSLAAQLLMFSLPGVVVAIAAVLVSTSWNLHIPSGKTGVSAWWPVIWPLSLVAVLLGYLTYTIVWASIWDNTSDGMSGLFLSMPTSLVGIGAGMVMATTTTGWRRLGGLAFAVLVPLAIFGAFNYGWSVSYHALTEAHAARIQAAVEHFHSRSGSYPAELRQLIPTEVWWIPQPVILSGQGWCYQGGSDYYRLGALFRENWGLPLSIRIYASTGNPPEAVWECDKKLTELKLRYDPQPAPGSPTVIPR